LRLVPPLPPAPGEADAERLLVAAAGFRLTSERLEADGYSLRLEDIRGFGMGHVAPGLKLPLGLGSAAALVVPVLLLQPDSLRVTLALAVATVLLFTSMVCLVAAADTYWLTVRTADGERQVLRCQDRQLFLSAVEALREALRGEAPPAPPRRLSLVR
jgi:hypothetical protein